MTSERPSLTRRRTIQLGVASAVASFAGCSAASNPDPTRSLAVRISNRLPETQPIAILVVSDEGETVEIAEYEIRPDAARTHRFENSPAGTYRIVVDGNRWRTTARWETTTCSRFVVETTLEEGTDGMAHTSLSASCEDD